MLRLLKWGYRHWKKKQGDEQMSKFRPKAVHNLYLDGFVGKITDDEMYAKVRDGLLDWTPEVKSKLKAVTIPIDTFKRLMALDKQVEAVPFEVEVENCEKDS